MEAAGIKIERAKESDIASMLEFWRTIPGLREDSGEESLRVFIKRNPSTCMVLRDGERLIGTLLGGFDGHRGYIYHLAVHPDYQGRGYGQALFSSVTRALKNLGAPKVHLFVFRDNQKAITFYRKQGGEQRQDIYVFSWPLKGR
jgi:ribosomal protein S18 acetylase RimI-like enzyme